MIIESLIKEAIRSHYDVPTQIKQILPISGGDINDAFCVELSDRQVFLKTNRSAHAYQMFLKEKEGLKALKINNISVPEVLGIGSYGDFSYLLLERIVEAPKTPSFKTAFTDELCKLHGTLSMQFGWSSDNYIGPIPQINLPDHDGIRFLFEKRFMYIAKLVIQKGLASTGLLRRIESLQKNTSDFFTNERAVMLHGDLWSGNILYNGQKAILIDPSVYYGYKEMDLAMLHNFGGIHFLDLEVYNAKYPFCKERLEVCSLYPFLVHVALFGKSYWSSVDSILKNYGA